MIERAEQRDYELVAALRQDTFELLERYQRGCNGAKDTRIIVALQDAANRLGAAERGLQEEPGTA